MSGSRFLFNNGVVLRSPDAPPVSTFLEQHPGAYTTTRTHETTRSLLFWERHLRRLANSTRILLNSSPELMFKSNDSSQISSLFSESTLSLERDIRGLVSGSMSKALNIALDESYRRDGVELTVTVLVSGDSEKLSRFRGNVGGDGVLDVLNVWLHIGSYTPGLFGVRENAAHLALVGHGRDVAAAKYSDWVRVRKPLEKLRPPMATELLLSNDGDHILEGCITNFFVICRKDLSKALGKLPRSYGSTYCFEVQTASITDGVLPGVLRELVLEVCLSEGIHVREVAPSWSEHELWEEAFITNSLRILQHVESIKAPTEPWQSLNSKIAGEISWKEKRFKEGPGMVTQIVQKAIMEKVKLEGYPLHNFV